jgi:hypothetical protein
MAVSSSPAKSTTIRFCHILDIAPLLEAPVTAPEG